MKYKIELDSSRLKDPLVILKITVVLILAAILIYFKVDLVDTIIAFYFLLAILFSLESRYSFAIGLLFLVLTAFLQILGKERIAENYAVYTFYFLVIGTIGALIEVAKDKKLDNN
jgi:cell division protein FtsW (lipid II flippase)